jgi:dihydrodipicolinate synthase/N-acetylneuraminate lyase
VAAEIPLVGFYLQPAVGGIVLPVSFWRRFAAIDNVIAIKIAPFNRYRTLDVVRGVVEAGAEDRITLLTGNDDHIGADLLTAFRFRRGDELVTVRITGGLLGHWCVWTKRAVELMARIRHNLAEGALDPALLTLDAAVTDCNGALFDAANDFKGCIAGVHEVLRRQGLLEGTWCLDPNEQLSPGQAAEIDRVHAAYPELNDDAFVAANLERWLA